MNSFILIFLALIANTTITIKSPAFSNNGNIPAKFTCSGDNINPELNIGTVPKETKTLALIMDDPDAPGGMFVHWVMWNIPPKETIDDNFTIDQNSAPGVQGLNGKKENKYTGPCPPSGTHHYHFKIYALDTKLNLPTATDKEALLKAMKGHIIGQGELIGLFKK
ncbi:MAG: YbhB/YbcL family Raf kinase inhibitor-like protein [Bacteroidia bacterium]